MQLKKHFFVFAALVSLFAACKSTNQGADNTEANKVLQDSVQTYLNAYNKTYQQLYTASAEAAWAVNTRIVEGDSTNAVAARKADEAMAEFTGSKENIEMARIYLAKKDALTGVQVKQLETILYAAANNPATLKNIVSQRIKAETAQTEALFGYNFTINGKKVSTNDIDEILTKNWFKQIKTTRALQNL